MSGICLRCGGKLPDDCCPTKKYCDACAAERNWELTRERQRKAVKRMREAGELSMNDLMVLGHITTPEGAAEVLRLYQYGIPGEVPSHSFDINDETVEIILTALDERDRAMKRLCDWCGVGCNPENRRAELCEIAAVGKEFNSPWEK